MIYERPGKRRMRWVVEYLDDSGKRRYRTCYTLADAKRYEAERTLDPGGNPLVTVGDVAKRWLEVSKAKVRPQSYKNYENTVRLHIMPTLGTRRASSVRPSDIELLLVRRLEDGLKPKTVATIQTVVYGIFKRAVRDGVVRANPATGLTGELRLTRRAKAPDRIKAFTPEELAAFLDSALARYPHLHPLFLTMASTGIRIGEALGLKWTDVDFDGHEEGGERVYGITVARTMLRDGRIDQTKNARVRQVDVDRDVREMLWQLFRSFQERNLSAGRSLPDWIFQRSEGGHLSAGRVRDKFKVILAGAGLPLHYSPHALRHTFAAVHIKSGTDLGYVKEQLGHWSIQMTYDTYGHWQNKSSSSAARKFQEVIGGSKK